MSNETAEQPTPEFLEHDWWDPGEKYPRLRMTSSIDGSIILSCKRCGIVKGVNSTKKPCPGVVKVELRGASAQPGLLSH